MCTSWRRSQAPERLGCAEICPYWRHVLLTHRLLVHACLGCAGDALFFYSMTPDTALDKHSLHGGCPVLKGTKWSATKWMRVAEYKV